VPGHGDVDDPGLVLVDAVQPRGAPVGNERRCPGRKDGRRRPEMPRPLDAPWAERPGALTKQPPGGELLVDFVITPAHAPELPAGHDGMLFTTEGIHVVGQVEGGFVFLRVFVGRFRSHSLLGGLHPSSFPNRRSFAGMERKRNAGMAGAGEVRQLAFLYRDRAENERQNREPLARAELAFLYRNRVEKERRNG